MWLLLFVGVSVAAAPAPDVEALVAPDGTYVLRLSPAQPWTAAEVSVSGGSSEDVGAQQAGASFSVEGDLPVPGTMWVTVNAALSETHGVSWVFSVEPQIVPMRSPRLERMKREPRRCRLLWWRRS